MSSSLGDAVETNVYIDLYIVIDKYGAVEGKKMLFIRRLFALVISLVERVAYNCLVEPAVPLISSGVVRSRKGRALLFRTQDDGIELRYTHGRLIINLK